MNELSGKQVATLFILAFLYVANDVLRHRRVRRMDHTLELLERDVTQCFQMVADMRTERDVDLRLLALENKREET